MFRLIGGILAIILCSFAGIFQSRKLSFRVTELEEAILLCRKAKTYLAYENTDTRELIRKLSEEEGLSHLKFLPAVFESMKEGQPFPKAWKRGIERGKNSTNLTQGDVRVLMMFSDVIGKSDRNSQIGGIELIEQLFSQAIDAAKRIREEKGVLYRSLGILGGIGLAVLFL